MIKKKIIEESLKNLESQISKSRFFLKAPLPQKPDL